MLENPISKRILERKFQKGVLIKVKVENERLALDCERGGGRIHVEVQKNDDNSAGTTKNASDRPALAELVEDFVDGSGLRIHVDGTALLYYIAIMTVTFISCIGSRIVHRLRKRH